MRLTTGHLLTRYDAALRGATQFASALTVERDGPVLRGTYPGGRGRVEHDAGAWEGVATAEVDAAVARTCAYFAADEAVTSVEWKTRGHDAVMPRLHDALLAQGFVPEEAESVMIGRCADLAGDVPVLDRVTLRRVTTEADVRAMAAVADEAFGDPPSTRYADALLRRLDLEAGQDDAMQLWVAEADGRIVCTGRLEPVPGTEFAGICGGATLPAWRGRGIYRALTAARARAALELGRTLVQSDSTPDSEPILARSGLVRVTTTTPYVWRRP